MATPQSARPPSPLRRVVVGVDGSPGSLAALRWAVQEASLRGVAVHAVT
ncbi:MAG: universal stress protein, partial [Sciscionella sp.]